MKLRLRCLAWSRERHLPDNRRHTGRADSPRIRVYRHRSTGPDVRAAPRHRRDVAGAVGAARGRGRPRLRPRGGPTPQGEAPAASSHRSARGVWSTRVSLLLVAALVGGLAGHYAAPSSNTTGGVTVNEVSNSPAGAVLPNGTSIPTLVRRVVPSVVSIDVKGAGSEDQGTGMIISSTMASS